MSRVKLRATSKFVRDIVKIREEAQQQLILQMRALLPPLTDQMRQARATNGYKQGLKLLTSHIEDMTSGFSTSLQANAALSLGELRIALMIKDGMTNEEIASYLHITPETVKTYRRNIRKKLELTGTQLELGAYLRSLAYEASAHGSDKAH